MFGQKHILNRHKTASILSQGVEVDLNLERPDSKIQVFQIPQTFPKKYDLNFRKTKAE